MSRRKVMIELTPPAHNGHEEVMVSPGHRCGYCHGEGGFRTDGGPHGKDGWRTCPVCNGRCEVDAVITIRWKPSAVSN